MSVTTEKSGATAIRPFHVDIPDEALEDLRRRIAATRLPSKELVPDRSQGVQLETIQELARYWATEYDWRRCEARLNALPQFKTEIDGVDVHFIHVKSRHEDALPLIMTHGWPGSVIELLETVGPLTDPTAHGGRAEDAFHLVLPSVPGYGFSAEPTELGWYAGRVAQAWGKLMPRLGYTRYVAQGGDVGAAVTDAMGRQAPEGLIGIHTNLFVPGLAGGSFPKETEEERAAAEAGATFRATGFGYFLEQTTRPQTIGYALLDSPVALAAWMLDHDTDSYYKISRAFVDRSRGRSDPRPHPRQHHHLLADRHRSLGGPLVLGERTSHSSRGRSGPSAGLRPVGFTTFPGEIVATPRSWVEKAYPTLTYFNKVDKGGHFAAWEEPELFATEIRAAFQTLR
jgi:pimeloyl-ACP methyl ester carboxylesterase